MDMDLQDKEYFQKSKADRIYALRISICLSLIYSGYLQSQNVTTNIRLNQLGFYPNAPKVAVVIGSASPSKFYITSTNLRDTVFSGDLSEEKSSSFSATKTRIADFSLLLKKGSFVVLVPGLGHSYVFEIGNNVHRKAAIATLKGYYFQRASMPLEERFAGKWHRSSGHPDNIVYIHASSASSLRPEGTVISTPGGWYDAGDYNKYIVNSGITMGTLLSAYEDFPEYFKQLSTNIPESGNGVPDILNEVIYNLRWMLTMQDPNDGGVYNKCTNASFDGMVMPGITKTPRYVVQKGTTATLDLAAVAAQASRVLRGYKRLSGLADSCLLASNKAWLWALQNPSIEYNQGTLNLTYKPPISTGGYGDNKFTDEWFWAATELYISTRENKFYAIASQHINDKVSLPGWSDVAMLGYYSFLRFRNDLPALTADNAELMKAKIIGMANGFIEKDSVNAFQTVMGQSVKDFIWGSNSVAGNQGVLLINAYLLTNDKKYVDGALTNLDYLFGRNATGYCFVTGLGSKSPMFPHHRQSTADGITDPVPGLVVGGPNPGMQDKCKYEFTEPETSYSDNICSYASNEIAINWNAPIVYLSNAIEALKMGVGYTKGK